jgi:hypothetical protein
MRRLLFSLIVARALLAPGLVAAQKVPVGPTFQVNTFTLGNQGGYTDCLYNYNEWGGQQTVGADGAGNFVVVWRTEADQDGSYSGIMARRYDSAGAPQGGEFVVSQTTLGYQTNPAVAMDAAGNFVVAWNDGGSYGNGYFHTGTYPVRVAARRFDSTGAPSGSEFQVSVDSYPYDAYQGAPALALDGAGNVIVAWTQIQNGLPDEMSIIGRRFDSAGAALGGEIQVSDPDPGFRNNSFPSVAAKPDGSFVIAWEANSYYAGNPILARRYDSAGAPQSSEFAVSAAAPGYPVFDEAANVAALAGGDFVVAWINYDGSGSYDGYNIRGRFLDSTGVPVGGEFAVNTTTEASQVCPAVAAGGDGGFVVTWNSHFNQARGQQFDGSGGLIGGEFFVNPDASQDHESRATKVAADATGDFVVVWMGEYESDGYGFGVFAQRFGTPGPCHFAPKTGCREETVSRRGLFRFKESTNPKRSKLLWRWVKGQATATEDFGDPFTDTDYALCVYDASGGAQPVQALVAEAGGTCGSGPCWRHLSGSGPSQPIEYFDRPTESGTGTNPDGVRRIGLRPGADGKAQVRVEARGVNLGLPDLPLAQPVVVQLQASNGECWTSSFDAFVQENAGTAFRARSGSPSGAFVDGPET